MKMSEKFRNNNNNNDNNSDNPLTSCHTDGGNKESSIFIIWTLRL